MGWSSLDDGFFSHPKVIDLLLNPEVNGWQAIGVWAVALSWAHRYTIDKPPVEQGVIPARQILAWDRMTPGALAAAEDLANVKLWDRLESGSYRIHDFREWAQLELRESKIRAGRKGAQVRWHPDELFDEAAIGGSNGTATSSANGRPIDVPIAGATGLPVTPSPTLPSPSPSPSKDSDAARAAEFERFWRIYPKRVARAAAKRAWDAAVDGTGKMHEKPTPPQVIFDGAYRYAEDPNRKPQYTKNATTWLNGECWTDELESAAPAVRERGTWDD